MDAFPDFEAQFNDVPEIALPEKCEGCGVQCMLHERLAGLHTVKRYMEQAAGSLLGEAGAGFDAMVDSQLPMEAAAQVKQTVRQNTGDHLAAVDQSIEDTGLQINANALGCSGVLKMRATKGDVTYTVNVCTSPKPYIRDGDPALLPTTIKAASSNKL